MGRGVRIAAAACLAALLPCTAAAEGGLTRIADNVYAYVGVKNASAANSFGANAGVIVGSRGALVVDTLISAKEGTRLARDVAAVTGAPVLYVVDTHAHLDHVLGNCVFKDRGAAIVAHAATAGEIASAGDKILAAAASFGLTKEDLEGTRVVAPEIAFDGRLRIDLGGLAVELLHVAPSHSRGSILVHVPERKVLFAGDALFTDFHPYMGEGDLEGWGRTLDAIAALDVDAIVPGHGPLSGKKDLLEMKAYLADFDRKARDLASAGKTAEEAAAALKESLPRRAGGEFLIPANVGRYIPAKKE